MEISLFMVAFMVFTLACFVGYHVIWGVTPALHTPLMAVTNAMSGIVIVGAMMVAGASVWDPEMLDKAKIMAATLPVRDGVLLAKAIGAVAIFLASINIFGGFVVTGRMLAMFKPKQK